MTLNCEEISNLNNTDKFDVKTIGNLVENKELQIKRGNEIGSQFWKRRSPIIRTTL